MTTTAAKTMMTAFGGVRPPDIWKSTETPRSKDTVFEDTIDGAYQTREEIEWIDRLVQDLKPRFILEIGVARGGVSRLFCDAVGPDGHVVGLDITDDLVAEDVKRRPNYTLIVGDSHDPAILAQVRALHESYDLLLIDGDHTAVGVRQDTEWYLPLVKDGGMVLWHDVRLEPDAGIKPYWYGELRRQLPGAGEFYVDAYNNGLGFWRKTPKRMADLIREAEIHRKAGRLHEALKTLAVVADGDPYYPGLWLLWHDVAVAGGAPDDAAKALARAFFLGETDITRHHQVASDGLATLIDRAISCVNAGPITAELALRRAELARELGLLDRAITDTRTVLEVTPENLAARRSLLELMTANNHTQRELIDVVLSGIRVGGAQASEKQIAFDDLTDWIERLQNRSFIMQRFEEMIDFAVLLRQESPSFLTPCLAVLERKADHPNFKRLRASLESRIAELPEAAVLLRPS